jgi:hypothetical protein
LQRDDPSHAGELRRPLPTPPVNAAPASGGLLGWAGAAPPALMGSRQDSSISPSSRSYSALPFDSIAGVIPELRSMFFARLVFISRW